MRKFKNKTDWAISIQATDSKKERIRTMVWKPYDTDSEYEISDTGLVRKTHYHKTYEDRDGYLHVTITKGGRHFSPTVHRLVMHVFDPRPNEDELEVHHIDGNPKNNNLSNLMWCTHAENLAAINRSKSPLRVSRPVEQYTLNGIYVDTYTSYGEAERKTGCSARRIGEVCRGTRKSTGGYYWKSVEGSTTNCNNKCYETEGTSNSEDIV